MLERFWLKVTRVNLPAADAERLRDACAGPALLCANHPTLHEPVVVCHCCLRVGATPHWVIARDTMEAMRPFRRYLQSIGGFSIRRGTTDRAAFATTRDILSRDEQIVIFPEGETYGLNDHLISFHEGVAQMGFWGVQDRQKNGRSAPVAVVPIAIKYLYQRDMRPAIDRSLSRLERELGLRNASLPRYERLRGVGLACARALEREFQVVMPESASLDDRIRGVQNVILDRVALAVGKPLPDGTLQDKLRRLFAIILEDDESRREETSYEAKVSEEHEPAWRAFRRDLVRLQMFQAVRDGYVGEYPSAERYLDMLGRLELEVLGKAPIKGPRVAEVRVGEPVDLSARWGDYRADRRAAVQAATGELRERVRAMLDGLSHLPPPIDD